MRFGWMRGAAVAGFGVLLLGGWWAGAQVVAADSGAARALVGGEKQHLFGGEFDARAPQAEPAAVKAEWAGLIGEYGWDLGKFYVLEDGGELKILSGWFDFETLRAKAADVFELGASGPHGAQTLTFERDAAGAVTGVAMGGVVYKRRPFDGPGDFFHIVPVRPVEVLRKAALGDRPPVETGNFRRPELVQLNVLDPTIKLDIRYATSRNF